MTISVYIKHDWDTFTLDASFSTPAGITALFGRSGSGKTSIINAVAGLFTPQSAKINIGELCVFDTQKNINIAPHHRGIGYVFQNARLFPHMSVMKNLAYASRHGRAGAAPTDFDAIIDMLDIRPILHRNPAALSGGEQQRVAIARALLSSPRVLLMDEPLSALDEPRKAEILPYLERMRDTVKIPILYVSHSMAEVARLANHLVILDKGRITAEGPTQTILSDPGMVPFIGVRSAGASIDATIAEHEHDGLTRLLSSGGTLFLPRIHGNIGQPVRVRILAQDVTIALTRPTDISALNILECQVSGIRSGDGPGAIVSLQTGNDVILSRVTKRSVQLLNLTAGTKCFAVIKTVSVSPTEVG